MAKRGGHGPGNYVCWDCFDIISNLPEYKNSMRLIDTGPPDFGLDYRAKIQAPCKRCGETIYKGQRTQKMSVDTPFSALTVT